MANVPITSLPVASAPAMDDYLILQGASTQRIKWSTLLDKLWPVGSIYQSSSSTSPASFWGGTWERIKDRFLLAAGDTYAAGSTGGEAKHTLTTDEMPSHFHYVRIGNKSGSRSSRYITYDEGTNVSYWPGTEEATSTTKVGSSQPHNNMPPYIAKYIWQRIA